MRGSTTHQFGRFNTWSTSFKAPTNSHHKTTMKHSNRFHFNAWVHDSPARPLQYLEYANQGTHQFSPQNNHETFKPFPLQRLEHVLQGTHQFSQQNNHETFKPFPLQYLENVLQGTHQSLPQNNHETLLSCCFTSTEARWPIRDGRNIPTVST